MYNHAARKNQKTEWHRKMGGGGGGKHGIKENGRSVHKVIRIKANEKKSAVKKTVNSRQEITLFGWIAWCKIIIKQKIPCVYLLIIKRNKRRRSKNIFRGVSEVIHNILFYVVLFLSHILFLSNKTSRRKKLFNQMGVSVFWLKERTWAARRFCSLYIHTFSLHHISFSRWALSFSHFHLMHSPFFRCWCCCCNPFCSMTSLYGEGRFGSVGREQFLIICCCCCCVVAVFW